MDTPSAKHGRTPELKGRRDECAVLDQLIQAVEAGESRTLVVRGEPGVGKTALLNYLLERAAGCRIARAAGAQSESELAFARLHQLCGPFLDRLGCLPGPQRAALEVAFGLRSGAAPDQFLLGMAVLGLLSDVAGERPLVCAVDDAQWLDRASAQALGFVARHLVDKPVAVVFAARQPGEEPDLAGVAELVVSGLADSDARGLLGSAIPGPLDERVRDRIVAETRGIPRALLEVSGRLTPEELAGGFGLPGAAALCAEIEEGFQRRLAALPTATRRLLLVAAAELAADPVRVWRAAAQLGTGVTAAAPAAELIEFGGRVRFCHPLARSAIYRAATPEERHRVHRALADAIDPDADPDCRAWHRAHAAPGLDEDAAAELEHSVSRARLRGGLAAAAAFGERAAELTPDPARRAQRALAAAQAKHSAGAPQAALRLLAMAQAGPLDELGEARAERLGAQIAAGSGRGRDAPPLLLAAARRLEPLHPQLARDTYRDAFYATLTAGRLAPEGVLRQIAQAACAAPPTAPEPQAPDLLLDGLAAQTTEGYAAAAPMLKKALRAFADQDSFTGQDLGWLTLACRTAHNLWDDESWHTLSTRQIDLARRTGALRLLPVALLLAVPIRLLAGDLTEAAALAGEAATIARATGNPTAPYGPLLLAAWRGRHDETRELIASATRPMVAQGEGQWLTVAAWATAVASNARGRYEEALAAAEHGSEYLAELGLATWSLAELIEAAARTGQPERATGALRRLAEITTAGGSDWALGVYTRCQALLSDTPIAEDLYCDAIARLGRTRARADLARAHLLYGEWLRRRGRRADARQHLYAAHGMLAAMGADAFAERAQRELLATGETVRKRAAGTLGGLTAQEAQIARLASAGHTNPEISSQLFLSPRTVEWHLRKVFTKLGITSRKQLSGALSGPGRAALPT